MKFYVASSWRNTDYDYVLKCLNGSGHEVWDWRKPPTGGNGFKWQDIDPTYTDKEMVATYQLKPMLAHRVAQAAFASDFAGMHWCDVGVLLLPCGRSAHMEAGFIKGIGKPVYVLRENEDEPDLMHLIFDDIVENMVALLNKFERDD